MPKFRARRNNNNGNNDNNNNNANNNINNDNNNNNANNNNKRNNKRNNNKGSKNHPQLSSFPPLFRHLFASDWTAFEADIQDADPNSFVEADKDGRFLLHQAVAMGASPAVKLLLAKGANPCSLDDLGRSCFHIAERRYERSRKANDSSIQVELVDDSAVKSYLVSMTSIRKLRRGSRKKHKSPDYFGCIVLMFQSPFVSLRDVLVDNCITSQYACIRLMHSIGLPSILKFINQFRDADSGVDLPLVCAALTRVADTIICLERPRAAVFGSNVHAETWFQEMSIAFRGDNLLAQEEPMSSEFTFDVVLSVLMDRFVDHNTLMRWCKLVMRASARGKLSYQHAIHHKYQPPRLYLKGGKSVDDQMDEIANSWRDCRPLPVSDKTLLELALFVKQLGYVIARNASMKVELEKHPQVIGCVMELEFDQEVNVLGSMVDLLTGLLVLRVNTDSGDVRDPTILEIAERVLESHPHVPATPSSDEDGLWESYAQTSLHDDAPPSQPSRLTLVRDLIRDRRARNPTERNLDIVSAILLPLDPLWVEMNCLFGTVHEHSAKEVDFENLFGVLSAYNACMLVMGAQCGTSVPHDDVLQESVTNVALCRCLSEYLMYPLPHPSITFFDESSPAYSTSCELITPVGLVFVRPPFAPKTSTPFAAMNMARFCTHKTWEKGCTFCMLLRLGMGSFTDMTNAQFATPVFVQEYYMSQTHKLNAIMESAIGHEGHLCGQHLMFQWSSIDPKIRMSWLRDWVDYWRDMFQFENEDDLVTTFEADFGQFFGVRRRGPYSHASSEEVESIDFNDFEEEDSDMGSSSSSFDEDCLKRNLTVFENIDWRYTMFNLRHANSSREEIENLPRETELTLQVNRLGGLPDADNLRMLVDQIVSFTGPFILCDLGVKFLDEPGTGEGPLREFFQFFKDTVLVPPVDGAALPFLPLFVDQDNERDIKYFNFAGLPEDPKARKDAEKFYYVAGVIIARMLLDGRSLGIKLPKFLFEVARACGAYQDAESDPYGLEGVKEIDPTMSRSLMRLLADDYDHDAFPVFDEDGNQVTKATAEEYVLRKTKELVVPDNNDCFNAFRTGLKNFPEYLLRTFSAEDLQTLLVGEVEINVEELREQTQIIGFAKNSTVVQWFWQYVCTLSFADLQRLLLFWSGRDTMPKDNEDDEDLGFTLQPHASVPRRGECRKLPTASTCARIMSITRYSNYKDLETDFGLALGHGVFGFDNM